MMATPWTRRFYALIACAHIASCASAPATLKRIAHMNSDAESAEPLPKLLEQALLDPHSDASNHALAHFVERWKKQLGTPGGRLEAGGITYDIEFVGQGPGEYPLAYFDEISPAEDYEIHKLQHHLREGVGAPLVALRENRHREPIEIWFPPEVIARPLTALAEAAPLKQGSQKVRIRLLCPLINPSVVCHGKPWTLAADFSVPWAAALARTGKLNQSRVLDMLRRMPSRQPRLYLMEPYDPKREPLIMIHGLLSTPLAWAETSNELWADETIRRRYQIWHYHYNTSAPALYSARLLRAQLKEIRLLLDPDGNDPASRKTTLLTHSMGGLVGKALVVKPGDVFWQAAFTVPHETLHLSREDHASLQDAFEWEPERSVHRVIFVAVPHRGSQFADNWVGRIGTWITSPPIGFQTFYERISKHNPGVFTEDYEQLGRGRLDSVSSLSPRQPTLRILADLPFAEPIQAHSIIGDRGKPGRLEDSSDGIVPYLSSHLEGAASELVVPAGHSAFRHPAAMAEIRRILRLQP
jgi:pimeloyl-ACP methyl ester carboxylesterase